MSSSQIVKIGRLYERDINYGPSISELIAIGSDGGSEEKEEKKNTISLPKPRANVPAGKHPLTKYFLGDFGAVLESVGGMPPFSIDVRLLGSNISVDARLSDISLSLFQFSNGVSASQSPTFTNMEGGALSGISNYSVVEFLPQNDELFCDPSDMVKLYNEGPSVYELGAFSFYGTYYMNNTSSVVLTFIHYPSPFSGGLVEGDIIDIKLPNIEGVRRVVISNPRFFSGNPPGALTQIVDIANQDNTDPPISDTSIKGAFYSIDRENVSPIVPLKTTETLISENFNYNPEAGFDLPNYGRVINAVGNAITLDVFINNKILRRGDKLTLSYGDGTELKEVTIHRVSSFDTPYSPRFQAIVDIGESVSSDYKYWKFGGIGQPAIDPKLFLYPYPVELDDPGIQYYNYIVFLDGSGNVRMSRNDLTLPTVGETLELLNTSWGKSFKSVVSIANVEQDPATHTLEFDGSYTDTVVYRTTTSGLTRGGNRGSNGLPPILLRIFRAARLYNFYG